jgi:hypothetical protein
MHFRGRCLLPQTTGPTAAADPGKQFHARVEDAEDEGEPEGYTEATVSLNRARPNNLEALKNRNNPGVWPWQRQTHDECDGTPLQVGNNQAKKPAWSGRLANPWDDTIIKISGRNIGLGG